VSVVFYLLDIILFVYYAAKTKMATVQNEISNAITLKGSTEIVADFFGNEVYTTTYVHLLVTTGLLSSVNV